MLSPAALEEPDLKNWQIRIKHSDKTIKAGPGIEAHASVSLQHKQELAKHYGWPLHWTGLANDMPGIMTPPNLPVEPMDSDDFKDQENKDNFILRSSSEVEEYRVMIEDKHVGNVDDFLIEVPSWMIHFIVVREGHLKPQRKLVMSHYIEKIDFDTSTLTLKLLPNQFEETLKFKEETPISEEQQKQIKIYWNENQV